MKKITPVSVAIFTFLFGVSIYFVFLSFAVDKSKPLVEPVKYSSLPVLSLCEATRNHELFENKDVRIRADLTGKDELGFSIFEPDERDCANPRAKVSFLYENGYRETDNLLKQLTALSDENSTARVEVEIIGTLIDESKFSSACSGRFSHVAKEVKQLAPIKQLAFSGSR